MITESAVSCAPSFKVLAVLMKDRCELGKSNESYFP